MYFNTIIIETRFIGQLFVGFLNNLFYLKKKLVIYAPAGWGCSSAGIPSLGPEPLTSLAIFNEI